MTHKGATHDLTERRHAGVSTNKADTQVTLNSEAAVPTAVPTGSTVPIVNQNLACLGHFKEH